MALLLLAGLAVGRWFLAGGGALLPTPTATPTPGPTATPTPDFRATRNIQELLTRQAYQAAVLGVDTPTPPAPPTDTPTATPTLTPTAIPATPETTLTYRIPLPIVSRPGANTPTPTPTEASLPALEPPTPTPSPSPSPTLTATPRPTDTPTATPAPAAGHVLQGTIREAVQVRTGPSHRYPETVTLLEGEPVELRGRDRTGEWVYLCCLAGVEGWVRQLFVTLEGNSLPPGAPPDADPNDVRWLPERMPGPPPTLVAAPPPISPQDYPLYRRDPGNRAWSPDTILPGLGHAWMDPARATLAFSSPVVVAGESVLAASNDQHIYSFQRGASSQRWRYRLNSVAQVAPAVVGKVIYVADTEGRIYILQDQDNVAVFLRQATLEAPPNEGINVAEDRIYIPGDNHRLYALNRFDLSQVWVYETTGNHLHFPAVGNQLIYAGNGQLTALDLVDGARIWEKPIPVAAPPVYAWPGNRAFAELYVADESSLLWALDANTGEELWSAPTTDKVTGLAVDGTTVYASGDGFVAAFDRVSGAKQWEIAFPAQVVGGPIVAGDRLVLVTPQGSVQIFDAVSGAHLEDGFIATQVTDAAAVAGGWIFVPGANGSLYALKGAP